MDLARAVRKLPAFLFLFVLVWILVLPTTIIGAVGRSVTSEKAIRKPFLISDDFTEKFRNDISDAMARGTDHFLEKQGLDSLPVSRHFLKQEAIEEVSRVQKNLTSGEFTVTFLISISGSVLSIYSVIYLPKASSRLGGWADFWLTIAPIFATGIAITILVVVYLRFSVVSHLMYGVGDLEVGTSLDLFGMCMWNQLVATETGSMLRTYYVLHFCSTISDSMYQSALELMVHAIDPGTSKKEAMSEFMRDYWDELEKEIAD